MSNAEKIAASHAESRIFLEKRLFIFIRCAEFFTRDQSQSRLLKPNQDPPGGLIKNDSFYRQKSPFTKP
jgi:hypothetical protein